MLSKTSQLFTRFSIPWSRYFYRNGSALHSFPHAESARSWSEAMWEHLSSTAWASTTPVAREAVWSLSHGRHRPSQIHSSMQLVTDIGQCVPKKKSAEMTYIFRAWGSASTKAALQKATVETPNQKEITNQQLGRHAPFTLFCSGVPVMSSLEAAGNDLSASYSWLSEFLRRCAYWSSRSMIDSMKCDIRTTTHLINGQSLPFNVT